MLAPLHSASNNMFPQGSHDGRHIVFTSDRDGDPEIYVMDADGSHPVRLTHAPGRDAHPYFSPDNAASWSPDEKRIAFTSDRDGNSEIYVMGADGGNVRRLTHTRATERAAVWSPDGTKLLFSSDGDGPSEVYVMQALSGGC
jgi:TolB protein